MSLLSYSLVHCSDEMIEEVLMKRMALKNDILVGRMETAAAKQRRLANTHGGDNSQDSKPTQTKVQSRGPSAMLLLLLIDFGLPSSLLSQ